MTLFGTEELSLIAVAFLGSFLRIGVFFLLAPGLGEVLLPKRLRLSVALAFTSAAFPGILTGQEEFSLLWVVVEPLIGTFLGISIRFFVISIRTAGTIIAQSVSLSQFMGNPSSEPSTAIAEILTLGGLALLFSTGLPVQLLIFLKASYEIFPIGEPFALARSVQRIVAHSDYIMILAFRLAMPFIILSLIYNIALGVINKAIPQMMVMLVGAPAVTGLGLLLLAVAVGGILNLWATEFFNFISSGFLGAL
ncbi:flagellar biosynthetic protein FliR [Donghicola tyrosinivorans]|uniref:Flagellar biosynthetic protein FliR n=1 Tax=Donghicola tyrosinivorans TaxID=1652492 RepID=A0A2T0WY02_9RHOB|nr:flagellar biosynthetic protein FliR [Donghicola tyrosinivorans]PRY91568.1 flagellar biosynthetic protein FliR [Donghicola tyrosinivorans]